MKELVISLQIILDVEQLSQPESALADKDALRKLEHVKTNCYYHISSLLCITKIL